MSTQDETMAALEESLADAHGAEGVVAVAQARRDEAIRALLASGATPYRLAQLTGLSQPAIATIRDRPDRFVNAARRVMRDAGADPDDAGELAAWARETRGRGDSERETARHGVLVARDGRLVADTIQSHGDAGTPSASYVERLLVDGPDDAEGLEVGMAVPRLRGVLGVDVMHVKAWSVCYGSLKSPQV